MGVPFDMDMARKIRGQYDMVVIKKDPVLGIYLHDKTQNDEFPYSYEGYSRYPSTPKWITKKSFERRRKLGPPKPRKRRGKLRMREGDFSLDEMEIAERLIYGER